MSNFHHHPQGNIYIRTDSGVYCDTLSNFNADLASCEISPYAGLPQDCIERFYDPTGRKYVIEADYDQRGDEGFTDGDTYINNYYLIARAKSNREIAGDEGSLA